MIALGADHGGYKLKEEIRRYFDENGIEYKDYGTNSEERTSVIYACTSWGLHQSFVIYNFKDYVPDAGI